MKNTVSSSPSDAITLPSAFVCGGGTGVRSDLCGRIPASILASSLMDGAAWIMRIRTRRSSLWRSGVKEKSWVTYIEPPPSKESRPEDVIKYLARYLTGGPISDRRLISYDGSIVTFSARKGTTHGGSDETEDVPLPAGEFVRRWCLHILPQGFSKSRRYGGWSSQHQQRYIKQCRELLSRDGQQDGRTSEVPPATSDSTPAAAEPFERPCPICGHGLERLEFVHRTSWRDIFSSTDRPHWYRIREPCR